MIAQSDAGVEDGCEGVVDVAPPLFEELPSDAGGARGRRVLCLREESMCLFFGDRGEGADGAWGGVIREVKRNGSEVFGKEAVSEKIRHGVVIEVKVAVRTA